ncbi:MAG: ATP-binding protein [Acidobacteriota bacterium]
MKIRIKLLLYFILIAGVSSFIAIYFAINSISSRYKDTAVEKTRIIRREAENTFSEYLGELSRKGLFISELGEIMNNMKDPDEISAALELKMFFLSTINVKVVDSSGKIIAFKNNSLPSFIDEKILANGLFFLKENNSLIRRTGIVDLDGSICFVSVSPIVDHDTFERTGDLILEIPLNSEFADQMRNKIKSEIVIVSNSGKIATTFLDPNGERHFPEISNLDPGSDISLKIMGDNYLIDSFVIEDHNGKDLGKVIVCENINDIIQARKLDIRSLVFVFFIVIVSVIFFGIVIGNRISKPILILSRGAESISKGDFDIKIKASSRDEIGDLTNIFTNMADSLKTQKKDMEHMQLYLKNIIDSMPSIMIGVDSNGKVTQWNVEAEKKTGITQDNALGKQVGKIFPQFEKQLEGFRKSINEKKPQKMEKILEKVNEDILYKDIMIYPLISNGVEGAVIRMDDVTTRVRIEDMMIQTEKMMSVGGLAAGMAHEINNPLGGIMLGVQNIMRRLSDDLPSNIEKANECGVDFNKITEYLEKQKIMYFLDVILRSGERASDIVTNMLNFSRRSGDQMIACDIDDVLDKTVELAANDYDLKKKYDFRHIEIIREYAPNLPLVPCVKNEIQQVILNLLKNSVYAIFEEDNKIKEPKIILRLKRVENLAWIEVEDNGPGMDAETSKRIFEPFFTTKDIGVGTGLGLSVSYFIVTNIHKGSMYVESAPGKGSKFIIKLPFEEK